MSLRVTFDEQIFQMQSRGGVSRYFVETMRELMRDRSLGIDVVTPYTRVRNHHLPDAFPRRFEHISALPPTGVRGVLARRRTRRGTDDGGEVVHFTYYDADYLDAARGRPSVSTIHDMIPELFADEFGGRNPHRDKRQFADRSTALICVSETTRRDLLAVYGELEADISVVHLAVGDEFRDPRPTTVPLPDRYVLYVGQRAMYKDFGVLLDAMGSTAELSGVDLVCIGGPDLTADELEAATAQGLAGRIHHSRVDDDDLPGVYARAACLAYPSRYEGFGLPVLEAMAAGCPVVASDIEVFHETADTAADYFPPGDAAALGGRVARLLGDDAARSDLAVRGRLRAKDFTWRRTAAAHADVYRRAAEAGPR